uniref:Immunoglobulin domain-containing protein n=2 Tax=Cyprinus carpio TaxID=7962 RepID=A0A8C1XL16_CYPCA
MVGFNHHHIRKYYIYVFGRETKFVKPGDSVTLNSGLTEIMDNDVVRWRHGPGNTLLAEINKQTDRITVYDDVLDGRFRDRLKLDNQTGSLTITDPRHEHAGVYELEGKSLRKSFSLVIIDEISMKEGDSLTLNSGLTEIKDDEIQWKFRNRLKLDNQTGSLTITNTTTQHAGAYELLINNVRKRFFLAVYDEISVKEGDSLTLNSGRTEISKGEMFVWLYLNEIGFIAGIKAWDDNIPEYDDVLDGRFRDRLKLDKQTGSLTITNITTEHNGVYLGVVINRTSIPFFLAVYGELHIHSTCFIFIYFLITRYNINPHTILLLWCLFCCFILLFI